MKILFKILFALGFIMVALAAYSKFGGMYISNANNINLIGLIIGAIGWLGKSFIFPEMETNGIYGKLRQLLFYAGALSITYGFMSKFLKLPGASNAMLIAVILGFCYVVLIFFNDKKVDNDF